MAYCQGARAPGLLAVFLHFRSKRPCALPCLRLCASTCGFGTSAALAPDCDIEGDANCRPQHKCIRRLPMRKARGGFELRLMRDSGGARRPAAWVSPCPFLPEHRKGQGADLVGDGCYGVHRVGVGLLGGFGDDYLRREFGSHQVLHLVREIPVFHQETLGVFAALPKPHFAE